MAFFFALRMPSTVLDSIPVPIMFSSTARSMPSKGSEKDKVSSG